MSTPVSTHRPRSAEPSRSGLPARPIAAVVIVVVLLALVVVVLRVLGGGGGDGEDAPQRVAIPLGGRQAATVRIVNGADNIRVTTADLGQDLAVVTTPDGPKAGVAPETNIAGDLLSVGTKNVGDPGEGAVLTIDVQLNKNVLWDVAVATGGRDIALALGQGRVRSVELNGGADSADVTLPKPAGELNVRIPTGLASASVHLPDGTPVRVKFANGAGAANVDGAKAVGVKPGQTFYTGGGKKGEKQYTDAADKVFVDVAAGVGGITVDHATS